MSKNSLFVLWAIQAGVRLYAAGRKAYVEATLDRPLILPLPRGPGISTASARNFFKSDPQGTVIAQRDENARIRLLLAAINAGTLNPEDEEESALTLNGRKKNLSRHDFMRLAESLRLTEKQAFNTFDRFSTKLDAAYQTLEVGFCSLEMKERYKSLILGRAGCLEM